MLRAAVVIPIVLEAEPLVAFVRRALHLRRNPGQIAFPGGLIDETDADLRATALRELEEELGIRQDRVEVVARLDDVHVIDRSARVTPFVGLIEPPLSARLDSDEIAELHLVPLREIVARDAVRRGIEVLPGREIATWIFDYRGLHIWGATGRMLEAFVRAYESGAGGSFAETIALRSARPHGR
jgi:8-oxo-dGTP pyrophosphatase MutT (NUDIX family)